MPGNVLSKDRMQVFLSDPFGLVLGREREETHLTIGHYEHDGTDHRELDDDGSQRAYGLGNVLATHVQTVDHVAHQERDQRLTDTGGDRTDATKATLVVDISGG